LDLNRTKKDIAILSLRKRFNKTESIVPSPGIFAKRASFYVVLSLDLFRKAFLDDCRFLSDTRPSHAFYVSKTPDTIAALGSPDEQNPQVAVSLFCSLCFVPAFAGPQSILWQPALETSDLRGHCPSGHHTSKSCMKR